MWGIRKFSEGLAWNNCYPGCAAPCHPSPSVRWSSFKRRQIDEFGVSSLYNAENADVTSLLAELRTQHPGGIQGKKSFGEGRTEERAKRWGLDNRTVL